MDASRSRWDSSCVWILGVCGYRTIRDAIVLHLVAFSLPNNILLTTDDRFIRTWVELQTHTHRASKQSCRMIILSTSEALRIFDKEKKKLLQLSFSFHSCLFSLFIQRGRIRRRRERPSRGAQRPAWLWSWPGTWAGSPAGSPTMAAWTATTLRESQ